MISLQLLYLPQHLLAMPLGINNSAKQAKGKAVGKKAPKNVNERKTLALAAAELKNKILLEKWRPENYFVLALVYELMHNNDLAIAYFERAFALSPTNQYYKKKLSEAHYNRAENCYLSFKVNVQGWLQLIENLQRAIEVDPLNRSAHQMLGYVYEEIADVQREEKNEIQAKNYYKKALNQYSEVLKQNPKSRINYFIARIYFKIGKFNEANTHVKIYLKDYSDPEAVGLMERLKSQITP